ncbi:hypothetical protein SPBRAN_1628 [uncultured Candidatus Thioglobus sp.]|nr:hypothetical protein SPBRAN_1628 [uncultured Candidatus Thioglobus sp.]
MTTVKSGWQTRHGFLKQEQSAIKQLRKFIDQSLRSYVEAATRSLADRSIKLRFTYDGWATVLLDGGYQHQHTHSRADLVGVYCVERELLPAGAKLGGELTLLDPRSGKQAIQSAWNSEEVTLSPEPGKLIIFPAFLPHRVNEVSGSGHRITINFDVQVGMLPRE